MGSVSKFQKVKIVYGSFMGSGATLVEVSLHGLDSASVDLNPLAALKSKVKMTLLDSQLLNKGKTNT